VFSWLIALPRLNKDKFLDQADFLPRQLDSRAVSDLEMIAIGGFSPLTGLWSSQTMSE